VTHPSRRAQERAPQDEGEIREVLILRDAAAPLQDEERHTGSLILRRRESAVSKDVNDTRWIE
jgi:hypothetical protein